MKREAYEEALTERQHRLVLLQRAYARQKRSAALVLEGWDASGKGGIIRRVAWAMDPRALRVWSIGPPSAAEQRELWMQRFWRRVPRRGEFVIFDRSWYGRVLVERVEKLTDEAAWRRGYEEINRFERMLVDEGVRLVKLFLDITKETQFERFRDRYREPAKRWKLTEQDLRNRARWDEYVTAYRDMRKHCSPPEAPWVAIDANDKRTARIAAFDAILEGFGRGIDVEPPEAPPLVQAFFDGR
ncbi:UDP-galactose-lipid carrier transferase [Thalassobaculum fulvum]|uniref:UDP-galactose-lipid carrier transferase n=1 Tax=Thalassobaculum fulvum TaxID=1633335 RepID=A0A919CRF6_9PROT|nr:AMP phosphotransferase [Thalassobaculum fulvum]GHD57422.1 UDP-galactose-lipid carrier transferase [Thalassobaculum fulvum]